MDAVLAAAPDASFPAPVRATAMIDTGASGTVVNSSVIEALQLSAVGTIAIHTPSTTTPMHCEQFHVDVSFPNGVVVADVLVIRAPLVAAERVQADEL